MEKEAQETQTMEKGGQEAQEAQEALRLLASSKKRKHSECSDLNDQDDDSDNNPLKVGKSCTKVDDTSNKKSDPKGTDGSSTQSCDSDNTNKEKERKESTASNKDSQNEELGSGKKKEEKALEAATAEQDNSTEGKREVNNDADLGDDISEDEQLQQEEVGNTTAQYASSSSSSYSSPSKAKGEVTSRQTQNDKRWEEMFQRLKHFKEKYGNHFLAQVCKQDKSLYVWCANQRRRYKTNRMIAERQNRLKSIGFVWSVIELSAESTYSKEDQQWEKMFHRLQVYKNTFGDFNVPQMYDADRSLGSWVHNQRQAHRAKRLLPTRKKCLESIGFPWKPTSKGSCNSRSEVKWNSLYQKLVEYKSEHGDCLVPYRYRDRQLAEWVSTQRKANRARKLSPPRYNLLNALGFVWNLDEKSATNNTNSEQQQRNMNESSKTEGADSNQTHALEQQQSKNEDNNTEDVDSNSMPALQQKENDSTRQEGSPFCSYLFTLKQMVPNTVNSMQWDKMFQRLQEYKHQFGDCLVPHSYEKDKMLAVWVSNQRSAYKMKIMTHAKIEILESIGFEWNGNISCNSKPEKKWNDMFKRLEDYKKTFGDCLVPYRFHDKKLSEWVSTQRKAHRTNKLRDSRFQRLKAIGFVWEIDGRSAPKVSSPKKKNPGEQEKTKKDSEKDSEKDEENDTNHKDQSQRKDDHAEEKEQEVASFHDSEFLPELLVPKTMADIQWNEMFQRLQEYKRIHDHCLVPRSYEHDQPLAQWISTQRQRYKNNLMNPNRRKCLESIGFVWNVKEHGEPDQLWKDMFHRLKEYKELRGDCKVPFSYKEDKALGRWVSIQKGNYTRFELTPAKRYYLDSIGFLSHTESDENISYSKLKEERWNEMFQELKKYKKEHKTCLVPHRYVTEKHLGEKRLGEWVSLQRRRYRADKMTDERKRLLESVGFVWATKEYIDVQHNTSQLEKWESMFTSLEEYKQQHGNCLVPQTYKNDQKLGRWVCTQRQLNKMGKLTRDRQARLESIGFVWSVKEHKGISNPTARGKDDIVSVNETSSTST